MPILRKRGDSNPRYSYPYDSLANCWFQPLTHPSKMGHLPKSGAKVLLFFDMSKFFCKKMQKSVKKKKDVYTRNLLLYNVQKRRMSPDIQSFHLTLNLIP